MRVFTNTIRGNDYYKDLSEVSYIAAAIAGSRSKARDETGSAYVKGGRIEKKHQWTDMRDS